MLYVLAKFNDNYADEFDTHGFRVFTQEEYVDWLERVNYEFTAASIEQEKRKAEWTPRYKGDTFYNMGGLVETYFGTNEQLQWNSQEDFHSSLETSLITETEKDFLVKQFGWNVMTYGYGVFPDFEGQPEDDN